MKGGVDSNRDEIVVRNVEYRTEEIFYEQDVRQVERGISIEADVLDYMNIYRGLGPKSHPENLSDYNALVFEASGNGIMEVTLVKASISEWSEQYRTQLIMSPERELHAVPFDDLTSVDETSFDPNDVQMIVFSVLGTNSEFTRKQIEIGAVRFEEYTTTNTANPALSTAIETFPNPAADLINITLEDGSMLTSFEVVSSDGRRLLGSSLEQVTDTHTVNIETLPSGLYLLRLTTTNGSVKQTKFVKG